MNKACIKSAAEKILLKNIKLSSSSLVVAQDFEELDPSSWEQQDMFGIEAEYAQDSLENETGESAHSLTVKVTNGSRYAIAIDETNSEFREVAKIEAEYTIEYIATAELSEEEIAEFSRFNARHNCWTFWRQFVYSTCQQAQIPILKYLF